MRASSGSQSSRVAVMTALVALSLGNTIIAPPALAAASGCAAPKQLVIPAYAQFMSTNARYIVARIFPVGWSKSGLCAGIATEYADSAGRVTVAFMVMDTRTDRVIDSTVADYEATHAEEQDGAFAQFWSTNQNRICSTLATKGIAQRPLALVQLPYSWRDDPIDAYLEPSPPAAAPGPLSLVCRSKKRGEKRIATLQPVEAPDGIRVPVMVGGIPSPESDRLLVVLELAVPGGEGPPDFVSFPMFGCDLSSGFSPACSR